MPAPTQTRTANSGTSLAFLSNPTAGSFLALLITSASGTTPTVSGGGTWAQAGTTIGPADNGDFDSIFYCLSATGGATTVTWTITAIEAIIAEYPIAAASFDQTNESHGASGTLNSGNITTTQDTDFLFGYANASAAPTYNSGFTERTSVTNNERLALVDRDVTSIGTYAITSSNSLTSPGSRIVAIKLVVTTERKNYKRVIIQQRHDDLW